MKTALGIVAAMVLGGTVVGLTSQYLASAEVVDGDRPVTISIAGCRLFDTRPGPNNVGPRDTPVGEGETFTVKAVGESGDCPDGLIPPGATGLVLNVTALEATHATNVRVFPAGEPVPFISQLNPLPGEAIFANAVTTGLSADGGFSVFNQKGEVHLIADVTAYLVHHGHTDDHYTKAEVDSLIKSSADQTGEAFTALLDGKVDQQTFDDTVGKLNAGIEGLAERMPFVEWSISSNSHVVDGNADPADDVVLDVDLVAPAKGSVVVVASGSMLEHDEGEAIRCAVVDHLEVVPASKATTWTAPLDAPTANLAVTRSFQVAAGDEVTYRLVCRNTEGGLSAVEGPALAAFFFPD